MKKLLTGLFLMLAAGTVQATTMDTASTQTVTGSFLYTSTRAVVVQPRGNVDVSIGATVDDTSGALVYDLSKSTSPGIVIYNKDAQDVNSGNAFMTLISTNPNYGGYYIRIFRNDTKSNGEIRVDGPGPNYEEVETDQVTPAGKWEHGTSNDQFYVASRNAADNSYEKVIAFTPKRTSNGALILVTQSSLTFEDGAGSRVSFKAPASLGATWSHDLWTTANNANKTLTQVANGSPRALSWVTTYASSSTVAVAGATVPSRVGESIYLLDGTSCLGCTSTDTVKGAWACNQATNRTTKCQ